jgi:hypothetical protein
MSNQYHSEAEVVTPDDDYNKHIKLTLISGGARFYRPSELRSPDVMILPFSARDYLETHWQAHEHYDILGYHPFGTTLLCVVRVYHERTRLELAMKFMTWRLSDIVEYF